MTDKSSKSFPPPREMTDEAAAQIVRESVQIRAELEAKLRPMEGHEERFTKESRRLRLRTCEKHQVAEDDIPCCKCDQCLKEALEKARQEGIEEEKKRCRHCLKVGQAYDEGIEAGAEASADRKNDEISMAVKAAANFIIEAVAGALQEDPHSWSTRPCSTCRTVSGLLGRPFGCYAYAQARSRHKEGNS